MIAVIWAEQTANSVVLCQALTSQEQASTPSNMCAPVHSPAGTRVFDSVPYLFLCI